MRPQLHCGSPPLARVQVVRATSGEMRIEKLFSDEIDLTKREEGMQF